VGEGIFLQDGSHVWESFSLHRRAYDRSLRSAFAAMSCSPQRKGGPRERASCPSTAVTSSNGARERMTSNGTSAHFDTVLAYYNLLNWTAQEPAPPGVSLWDNGQIIPLATSLHMGVIGIRSHAAGALSSQVDRPIPPGTLLAQDVARAHTLDFLRLCRKFCSGGHEGAVAPVWVGIKQPGSRTVRPQCGLRLRPSPPSVVS